MVTKVFSSGEKLAIFSTIFKGSIFMITNVQFIVVSFKTKVFFNVLKPQFLSFFLLKT
jgi:hypothetical protein